MLNTYSVVPLNVSSVAPRVEAVFGCQDITKVVEDFDWSKLSTREKTADSHVHCDLAPSFGKLNQESVKDLDDKLKVIIAGTTRAIEKLPSDQRSWDNVTSTIAQNSLLQPLDHGIDRSDKLIKDGVNFFKVNGSPDPTIVKEVQAWFTSLISDEDVLASIKIDFDVLTKIVFWTGAIIDSFETFFGNSEYHERTLVDIGVLRYPDIDQPYFKLYRIKLTAWSDCTRVLFVQSDKNGITGQYNVRRYGPRESVMRQLKGETVKKAVQAAEDLFLLETAGTLKKL
ncbi:hypothetical protein BGZ68_001285 [Mortierella alpina]|nr:hypothetical protein BGZ68_001285 [Mortierella alpina]